MPLAIRLLTYACRRAISSPSLQTLFLAGDVGAVLVPNVLAMAAIAAVLLSAAARVTRLRLD